MKKLTITLIMIISLIIISSCSGGSYKIVKGTLDTTSDSTITGSYKTFDGHYYKNVEFEEGDTVHFHFTSTTDKGTIQAKIYYEDALISTIEDDTKVVIDKTGTYQVNVYGKNHGGSFTLSWDISKPQPIVTDSEDTVLEFNNFKLTRSELYDILKKNTGLYTLLNEIDRDLLAEYKDKVNTEELEDIISNDKKSQGEEAFYRDMIFQGVISSKEDPGAEEKIKDYYLLSFMQKAYAKDMAIYEVNDDESKNHAIQNAKDAYHKDLCIITLKYDSKSEADAIKEKLTQEDDIYQFFKVEYTNQHLDDPTTEDETTVEEPPFITETFNCEYDRAVDADYPVTSTFRDFIFKDTINDEPFGIGDYNKESKYIPSDHTFYFVYKVSTPQYIDNFRESEEFTLYIIDKLSQMKLSSTYIKNQIDDLRQSINLRIFDTELAEQYKVNFDNDFNPEENLLKIDNGQHILASYKIDGTTKYVYADDLYDLMKTRYATQLLLDKIDNESLKSIPKIQLSQAENDNIKTQINNYKTQYLQSEHTYSWSDHIFLTFGTFTEEQLFDILAAPILIERYIFGYEDHQGVARVTEEDINQAYQEWFSIQASHILFTFDPEDAESKALAFEKGKQIINGCTDNDEFRDGITEDTCYIYYDPEDSSNTELPFVGLDEIEVSQYTSAFEVIAAKYSQDPSASQNNGDLGFFGPGTMVEKFESAAKKIANRIDEGGVPFSLTPVESTIERQDSVIHGFHVIYITNSTDKPTLDVSEQTTYDQYLLDLDDTDVKIDEKYSQIQITKFNAYKMFRDSIELNLKKELRTQGYDNKILAELRDLRNFHFNDSELQVIYENINTLQKVYVTEDK